MKNVTITLEESLAKWAKVMAARNNKSLSKFIAQILENFKASIGNENEILTEFRMFPSRPLSTDSKERAFKREEIYDRTRVS